MTNLSTRSPANQRRVLTLLAVIAFCWTVVAWIHLYFFGYASMDSWSYTAPAAMARVPFALITPFVGTFRGLNHGWGLHWPGGLFLTSIVTPFLPHDPATYVTIYVFYWLLGIVAVAVLVWRLTASPWLAVSAFLLMACDRLCFAVTWEQRYELVNTAIAIAAMLALCGRQDRHAGLRSVTVGVVFFLFPLLHPVLSGLGLAWIVYLAFRTLVLRQSWKPLCVAAVAYAAGWAGFIAYYWSRPWLYDLFRVHARYNLELSRSESPPGIHTFLRVLLFHIDNPTREGVLVYLVAFGAVIYLLYAFWKSRSEWREYLSRQDLEIFTALGFGCSMVLAQFTFNLYYWVTAWPFAVALACMVAHRLMERFPRRRWPVAGVLALVVILHGGYFVGRTLLWRKTGFVNLRSHLREFVATLPKEGQILAPEVLWDTFADGRRTVLLNALPCNIGDTEQNKYAAYVATQIHSGDVLVTDTLASHPTLIDYHNPGWKELGHYKVTYQGTDQLRGYNLTVYQKL